MSHPAPEYTLAARATAGDASNLHTRPVYITPELSIGGPEIVVAAGPCSVEGYDMLLSSACHVRGAGAALLRGGAFKPRTSPYAFQGLGDEGLLLLAAVREETGMPIVTEVMDTRQVSRVAQIADLLQVGARNMQNFPLLAELGRSGKPVLLKRGASARISELLLAAEYVMANGNDRVILCERGIRTFETITRNTLDISAIPVLKRETHLPVIVDPSHSGGRADLVLPLALAAIAAGADGLIVEVHPDPSTALSDADQQLTFAEFTELMRSVALIAAATNRSVLSRPVPRADLTDAGVNLVAVSKRDSRRRAAAA
ncbi:MAG: 3-deoxy-7-phosphoheptulonate synthase [Gemmatimonadaceae bacterium]